MKNRIKAIQFTKDNYEKVCGFLTLITFDDLMTQIENKKKAIENGIEFEDRQLIDGHWRTVRKEVVKVGEWVVKVDGKFYAKTDEEYDKMLMEVL